MTTSAKMSELERYLYDQGFSGDIPQNSGHKNWIVIKRLLKNDPFYTFGIEQVTAAVKRREVDAKGVRKIMVEESGTTIQRFRRHGPGHFDTAKVAKSLVTAMAEIERRARTKQRLVFATGHPGAMTGLLNEIAIWGENLGANIVTIDAAITVDERFKLDMIGRVLVPSDNCSAIHSHEPIYMDALLKNTPVDFVVADHGFTGSALNHGIPAIGFYDTDDPGMPLAGALGLPVLAVPINDNNYNANGIALANYLIERFASATSKPRRSRARTH